MLRRFKNQQKLNIQSVDGLLELNKLIAKREQIEKENVEATLVIEANRNSLELHHKSLEIIEKEHFNKVSVAKKEYITVVNAIDDKNKELHSIEEMVNNLTSTKELLNQAIPRLLEAKQKLDLEIEKTTENLNLNKKNSEIYLENIRNVIEEDKKIHKDLSEKVSKLKTELRITSDLIKEENIVLGKRQKDLQIYEIRLRKQYPNETIIL